MVKLHPDILDAGWRMKIAYEDWQDNLGCTDDLHDFKRDFEHARDCYRIVKKRLEDAGIPTGMEK
jgi:hypothetical protein